MIRYFSDKEREDKERRLQEFPAFFRKLYHATPSVHNMYYNALNPLINGNTVLLDAGCGKKGIMAFYKSKTRFTVGIDLSLSAIKSNEYMDATAVSNLETIPFRQNTFDVIISAWTVEHLSKPEAAFREFYRILKPGGALILVTNSIFHPIMYLSAILPEGLRDMIKKRWYPPVIDEDTFPTYYRCNSLGKIEKCLNGMGFIKKESNYIGDPSVFLFSKIFPLVMIYERITDAAFLRRFKMHFVVYYVKRKI